MKTNVTIRIDEDVVESAKRLDFNISKICENALSQAVEEETRPYEITENSQILLEAELIYNVRDRILGVGFVVSNASEENVISDRISYLISVTDKELFTDLPDRQSIQIFKGTILERKTIPKGSRELFLPERLVPSPDLAKRLAEVTYEDNRNLRWVIFPELIVDSRRRVLRAKYEQMWDKKEMFPVPRALKAV